MKILIELLIENEYCKWGNNAKVVDFNKINNQNGVILPDFFDHDWLWSKWTFIFTGNAN